MISHVYLKFLSLFDLVLWFPKHLIIFISLLLWTIVEFCDYYFTLPLIGNLMKFLSAVNILSFRSTKYKLWNLITVDPLST